MSTQLLSVGASYVSPKTLAKEPFHPPIPSSISMSSFSRSTTRLSCSLPILCSLEKPIIKRSPPSKPEVPLAGSLPDLSSLCKHRRSRRVNSFDSVNESYTSSLMPALVGLQKSLVKLTLSDQNNNLLNGNARETLTISNGIGALSSGSLETDKQEPEKNGKSRRKNSNMAPIVPDLELMAKLAQEDAEAERQKIVEQLCKIPPEIKIEETSTRPQNGLTVTSHKSANSADAVSNGVLDKTPPLSKCRDSFSTEKESAAAWLAAATHQLSRLGGTSSPTSCRLSYNASGIELAKLPHSESKENVIKPNQTTVAKPKLLAPFGKEDRVRRTSILRSQSVSVGTYEKKNVRFADTMGYQLENIRYYVISPQINRRYSSYTAPTFLDNSWSTNSWNMFSDKTNHTNNNTPTQSVPCAPSFKSDPLSSVRMVPRYELKPANFTSPSLQLDFQSKLEKHSVLLHSLTIAETTVYGTVSVMNMHFVKKVFVRYTFDEWQTHIEREASYMLGSHDGKTDKFSFVIYARPQDFQAGNLGGYSSPFYSIHSSSAVRNTPVRMFFAVRFCTGDNAEFWDNNDGRNYCLSLAPY